MATTAGVGEWVSQRGLARELIAGDYLDVVGDGVQDRHERLVCRLISHIRPGSRQNHLEVMLAPDRCGGPKRWSLHLEYPVTYRRRAALIARKELQIHAR